MSLLRESHGRKPQGGCRRVTVPLRTCPHLVYWLRQLNLGSFSMAKWTGRIQDSQQALNGLFDIRWETFDQN